MRANHTFKAVLVALSTGFVPAAFAADLGFGSLRGTQYGEPMSETHLWDGVYFGGFGGLTEARSQTRGSLTPSSFPGGTSNAALVAANIAFGPLRPAEKTSNRTTFGAFAGLNYQFDEVVLGFEADFTIANLRSSSTDRRSSVAYSSYTGTTNVELREVATLRARAGYTIGSFMPFATLGLAVARANVEQELAAVHATNPAMSGTLSKRSSGEFALGLATGFGVDVAVSDNLFLRGEWQYLWLPQVSGAKLQVNNFRAAAGVKF